MGGTLWRVPALRGGGEEGTGTPEAEPEEGLPMAGALGGPRVRCGIRQRLWGVVQPSARTWWKGSSSRGWAGPVHAQQQPARAAE